MSRDAGLDALLDLNGQTFVEECGYWYKFEVRMVEPSDVVPHGIKYNLTLHDQYNRRVMGFDNAHAVQPKKGSRFRGRRVVYDHKHVDEKDKGTPYDFSSAAQLLEDFFDEANRIVREVEK